MPNLKFLILLPLLIISGCASLPSAPKNYAYITRTTKFNLLALNDLNKSITLNQSMTGKYGKKNYNLNLVSQITPGNIKIAGLTEFGTRIFAIDYDNTSIKFEPSQLVKETLNIRPEYILADMQLVYWPLEALKKNLTGDVAITENNRKRVVSVAGKPVIQITYSDNDKWKSIINYTHLERSYEYTIKNL
jgi:hypothetical protein